MVPSMPRHSVDDGRPADTPTNLESAEGAASAHNLEQGGCDGAMLSVVGWELSEGGKSKLCMPSLIDARGFLPPS
jgi:hypothetical protein